MSVKPMINHSVFIIFLILCVQCRHSEERNSHQNISDRAHQIHFSSILVDGHNDLPYRIRNAFKNDLQSFNLNDYQPLFHTDIPRLKKGGVGAQFWSVYVDADTAGTVDSIRMTIEQIDLVHRMVELYSDTFEMAYTADDIVRIHNDGKIASLIGVEGGNMIENSLAVLRNYYDRGARYLTLTHSNTIEWADSATDDAQHDGLTEFGEEVIHEMNRLGMLVDISHVSFDTMYDVLRVSQAPVIASHSSAYALAPHKRNVPDDVLKLIKKNGGVVMVNFYSGYISEQAVNRSQHLFDVRRQFRAEFPKEEDYNNAMMRWRRANPIPKGTVSDVVDHIDHIVKMAGIDHVGLGADYDGVSLLPEGLEDVSGYPLITEELLSRGYSETDIRKILGGNAIRALREAENYSRSVIRLK